MMQRKTPILFGMLAVALLLLAVPTTADEACTTPEVTSEEVVRAAVPTPVTLEPVTLEQAQQALTAAGLRVVRDPETGQLRAPTDAEAAHLFALEATDKLRAPAEPNLVLEQNADGTVLLHLDERFHKAAVVTLDAEGRPVIEHHVDAATFEAQALAAAARAAEQKDASSEEVPQ